MATEFSLRHEFRASGPAAVFRAYFDETLAAEEDRRVDVVKREVLAVNDDGAVLHRRSRCVPRRQLPSFLRWGDAELSYTEELTWRRAEDRIELDVRPSLFTTRIHGTTVYRLAALGPGRVERTLDGIIEVSLPVIGRRIERAIADDLQRSLEIAATCTQEWLDQHDV